MDKFYKRIIKFSAFLTFSSLIFIVVYILGRGIPHLSLDLFSLNYTSENLSLIPSIVTTLILIFFTLLLGVPVGVFTGFYLVEYSHKSRFIELIRIATETLSGIPSIVYGLFGMIFFVGRLNLKYSLLSGILTMSIMILPLVIRSTEEALLSVDNKLREASFALGAGKLRTIIRVVLPVAMPGILSGIILSIGRIIGETAALIFTLGTVAEIPKSLMSSGRTLSLHMYMLSTTGMHIEKSYATGVVLLVVVLLLNYISTKLTNKLT